MAISTALADPPEPSRDTVAVATKPAEKKPQEGGSVRILELIDLFAGAGGTTEGAEQALRELGYTMNLVAINHWDVAINTHRRNHPEAQHYIQDVEHADPEAIVPKGYLDILLASPECRHFSRARGGKPRSEQGRINPWSIQKWVTAIRVKQLLVENVPEFEGWGRLLDNGQPDPADKGSLFQSWVRSLWDLGYAVEWRLLNAADYGEATSRVRFFLQARNDGKPIRWPEATHSREGGQGLEGERARWLGADSIIDWQLPGRSILDDARYQKKPLAINTRIRIAKGIIKYRGTLAVYYIPLLDLPAAIEAELLHKAQLVHPSKHQEPVAPTRQQTGDLEFQPQPAIQAFTCGNRTGNAARDPRQPLAGITTTSPGGGIFLAQSQLLPLQQQIGTPTEELNTPMILNYYGQSGCSGVDRPLGGITAQAKKHCLVEPLLVEYYGQSNCSPVDQPLPAITTKDRHALCQLNAHPQADLEEEETENCAAPRTTRDLDPRRLVRINGKPHILDIRYRMLTNRELARAMGFEDHESEYHFTGNASQVTRQIGNAVPVKLAAALVRAMLTD